MTHRFRVLTGLALLLLGQLCQSAETPFPGSKSQWKGYDRYDFPIDGCKCIVVTPKQVAPGRPWIWRARFFGHEPQTDTTLLSKGFHVVYMEVGGLFGAPKAVAHWNAFYDYLTKEHGFARKAALEGMSRGGLIIFNWAKANPDKVACIYADAPVCDFKSWPGGKGTGSGSAGGWKTCLSVYGLSEEEAMAYKGNPIDGLEPLAAAGVPLLHVCGGADKVVPVAENTAILEQRYKALGGSIETIIKPDCGHHPHSLKDPTPIVNFVLENTIGAPLPYVELRSGLDRCRNAFLKKKAGRVAFLGGSITNMEGYRPLVCKALTERFPDTTFDFINAGVSSTCSTTGAFRLATDVFQRGTVDLLFVEFAVNDNQDAHHTPEECVRGMEGIVRHARRTNPDIDIIFLYCANESHIRNCQAGKMPMEIVNHEKVAHAYDIPSVNFAQEIADRIKAGEFDWKTFGGCHPSPFGNTLYGERIETLFAAAWQKPPREKVPERRHLAAPLDSHCYQAGAYLDAKALPLGKGWAFSIPDWKQILGSKRARFTGSPLLHATTPGAALAVPFYGTAIGLFVVAGPDAGIVEFTIDGGTPRTVDLYHAFSGGLHYPRTCMLADDLKPGQHKAVLTVSANKNAKSSGNAVRIVQISVNQP